MMVVVRIELRMRWVDTRKEVKLLKSFRQPGVGGEGDHQSSLLLPCHLTLNVNIFTCEPDNNYNDR